MGEEMTCQSPNAPKTLAKPCMTDNEIALFDSYMINACRCLEFGSGNSTKYILSKHNVLRLVSIDTDSTFVEGLRQDPELVPHIQSGKLEFVHVDIGKTGQWGFPITPMNKLLFLNYSIKLWPKISEEFDIVIIDGRFRLATAFAGLIFMPESIFIFHDFLSRKNYFPLLKYINIIDLRDSLICYVARENNDVRTISSQLYQYLFDYS